MSGLIKNRNFELGKGGVPPYDYESNGGKPVLFTVTDPVFDEPMFEVMLALHIGPQSIDEKFTKTKQTTLTYGGFVDFIWPDELDIISSQMSTGMFICPDIGIASSTNVKSTSGSSGRKESIAYERYQDFIELFRNNGVVYDSNGRPSLSGRVLMTYDRGMFYGRFTSINIQENADSPFVFNMSWEFKVEKSAYIFNR